MYKILFKLFNIVDGVTDDPNKDAIYIHQRVPFEDEVFTSPDLDGAEWEVLKHGMFPRHEEVPPRKLSGHSVIRSYFDPEYGDDGIVARFYIVEEDD